MNRSMCSRTPFSVIALLLLVTACGNKEKILTGNPRIDPLTSNYVFTYENWMQPRVWGLRQQENLDEVIKGLNRDRQIFEALTRWTRQQFEPGFPDPYPLSNGISILEDIRSGKTKGFCGQYTYLLADALKSFGYFDVRYVEISLDEKNSHFLLEAWDNQEGHWLLLDPLYAALVVDPGGKAIGAWDVHRAVVEGKASDLRRFWLASEQQVPRTRDETYFSVFLHTAIALRNNLAEMDHPWTIRERQRDFLLIDDGPKGLQQPYQNQSGRMADFKEVRNLSWIEVMPQKNGYRVRLSNRNTCAYFDYFEVKLDQDSWKKVPEEFLLKKSFKTMYCRTVNKMGMPGVVTEFENL
jgi:hypothetical protein